MTFVKLKGLFIFLSKFGNFWYFPVRFSSLSRPKLFKPYKPNIYQFIHKTLMFSIVAFARAFKGLEIYEKYENCHKIVLNPVFWFI